MRHCCDWYLELVISTLAVVCWPLAGPQDMKLESWEHNSASKCRLYMLASASCLPCNIGEGCCTSPLMSVCEAPRQQRSTRFLVLGAGSELVIGPWSHGGLVDQSVAQGSSFDQPKHSMAFVNRCCDHAPAIVAGVQSQSQSSHTSQAQQRHDGTVSSNISDVAQMSEGQLGFEPVHTSEAHTRDGPQEGLSKEDEDAASPSVHFFMMGDAAHRGWRASHSWPPPHAASPPLKLFLDKAPAPAAKATRSWFGNYRKPAQVANTEDSASHHSTNPPPSQLDPPTSQLNPPPVWASTEGTAVTQVGPPTSRKHPELGQLSRVPAQQSCRFRHDVELQKHPKVSVVN